MHIKRLVIPVLCTLLLLPSVGCGLAAREPSSASELPLPESILGGEGESYWGEESTTTTTTEQYYFDDSGDVSFNGQTENSTVSTGNKKPNSSGNKKPTSSGQNGYSGGVYIEDPTVSAEINSDATDNEVFFKNIPVKLKGKTVIFADWGEANATEYQKVVMKFTKDTSIKVEMLVFSQTDYISKVAQQIAAGASPDIAVCNNAFPQALEVVQPLPIYFNINNGFWDPRVSEAAKVGSKYYFVNTYNSPFTGGYLVYYNKKIFNNNGLTSPQDYLAMDRWTYENLFQCMKDAKKLGYMGGVVESLPLAEQMGVSLMKYDPRSGTFSGTTTNANLVKAMQFMAKAVDEGLTGGSASTFANGQVGICMLDTDGLKYNGRFSGLSPSDIGVVPLPTSYDGQSLPYMPLSYRGYGICKGARNGEAAYYFLRYYLDLNKYEPAGANIFANKVLEKYFRQTHLSQLQNSPVYFEHYQGALSVINKPWSGSTWTAVRHAASSQVSTELSKMKNVVDSAAATATAKVRAYT